MRVCLISREYPPDTGWGGIGTFTYHLAHALIKIGHEVEVVALAGADAATSATSKDATAKDAQSKDPGSQFTTSTAEGIIVHRARPIRLHDERGLINFCLPVSRPMLEELSGLWNAFLKAHDAKPFDIVEAPEHFAEGAFVAASKPIPLVVRLHTPHSKLLKERFHNFTPSFDHRFLTALERYVMLSAEQLVSPSEDLAHYVADDIGCNLEKIAIIRNPVDIERFRPTGNKALNFAPKPMVLFVGRLEERKGIQYLVESIPKVLKEVGDAQFVIIGSDTMTGKDNRSVKADLERMLSESGSTASVRFIERVPLTEIADYYRSADVLVLPSLYDNAPCTVIEAMACGVPVVGTTAGGTKEYALHEHCGLIVPPKDSAALASALVQLLKDEPLRTQMGTNAHNRAKEFFYRERTASETIALYQSVLKRWNFNERQALYRGEPSELLNRFEEMVSAAEKTLYNLVFLHSMEFRVEHWLNKAKQDPSQIINKLLGS